MMAESLASVLERLGFPPVEPAVPACYAEDWSVEPEVRALLKSVAHQLAPSSYLEVGAHRGDTFAAIVAELPNGSRAYAVEPDPSMADLIRAKTRDNTGTCRCTIIQETSRTAFEKWGRERLDLVLIDGDHSLSETLFDIAAWSTLLSPDGLMVVHDSLTRLERRFPEDYVPNPWDYDIVDVVGLRRRTSIHAWEGVAFLRWTPEARILVEHRHLRGERH